VAANTLRVRARPHGSDNSEPLQAGSKVMLDWKGRGELYEAEVGLTLLSLPPVWTHCEPPPPELYF
jgi:hypothetical protein